MPDLQNGTLEAARVLIGKGEHGKADAALAALADRQPGHAPIFVERAHLAATMGQHDLAVQRWDDCLSRFPQRPPLAWHRCRAKALMRSGKVAEADAALAALAAGDPGNIKLLLDLATCATQAENWALAAARWAAVLDAAGAQAEAAWIGAQANALLHSNDIGGAIRAMTALRRRFPGHVNSAPKLAFLLAKSGDKTGAAAVIAEARTSGIDTTALAVVGSILAMRSSDQTKARAELARGLMLAKDATDLIACFHHLPTVHSGWDLTAAWLDIERRLAAMGDAADSADGALLALRLRVAFRDRRGYLRLWETLQGRVPRAWSFRLQRLAALLSATRYPDFTAEKVIGVGIEKTGTTSLHAAFEKLGFLSGHFTNCFTGAPLAAIDAPHFDALFDIVIAGVFEQIYYTFPKARFIVTTREKVAWEASLLAHIGRHTAGGFTRPASDTMPAGNPENAAWDMHFRMIQASVWRGHDTPLAAYEAWYRRVDSFIAAHDPSRFLRFDVTQGDGWQKLCAFLEIPVPAEPFPHKNKHGPGDAEADDRGAG